MVTAVMRSAAAFAEAGYAVVVDGVLGPWWLPRIAEELHPRGLGADYVLLTTGVEEALRRATSRARGADPRAVRHMHGAFARAQGFASHILDTTELALDDVVQTLQERRATGALRLDLAILGDTGQR